MTREPAAPKAPGPLCTLRTTVAAAIDDTPTVPERLTISPLVPVPATPCVCRPITPTNVGAVATPVPGEPKVLEFSEILKSKNLPKIFHLLLESIYYMKISKE
jgi:hypothetical protein